MSNLLKDNRVCIATLLAIGLAGGCTTNESIDASFGGIQPASTVQYVAPPLAHDQAPPMTLTTPPTTMSTANFVPVTVASTNPSSTTQSSTVPLSSTSTTAPPPSPSTSTTMSNSPQAEIVEFRIPAGTGKGPWNSFSNPVVASVGQTLRIYNDDNITHALHARGEPLKHGGPIKPGEYRDHLVLAPFEPVDGEVKMYNHGFGKTAAFWVRALP